jgi:hypothetical protein
MSPVAVGELDEPDGVVDGTVLIGRVVGAAEVATLRVPDECAALTCAVLVSAKKLRITSARGATNSNAVLRMSITFFDLDETAERHKLEGGVAYVRVGEA